MAQVSLPYTLTAGTPENVNNLMSNLTALRDGVNTIDTAQLASGAVTTAKIASAAVTSAKLAAAPYAELTQAATGVGNSSFVTPNFTTTTYDNGVATCSQALADLTNERIYLRRAGIWAIHGYVSWAANGTGSRWMEVTVSGNAIATDTSPPFSSIVPVDYAPCGLFYTTTTTDYASCRVFQNSGGTLDATATLRAVWIGNYS